MNIIDFTSKHIEEASTLARTNYMEEQIQVPILPENCEIPALSEFVENGLGVAAFDESGMLGYLGCHSPWDHAFGTPAKGVFSPIHAHGAVSNNRIMIYKKLYQAAAEKWVDRGITYHAIALYAHDTQAIKSFFTYGFGLRCIDAIRSMNEFECPYVDVDCYELNKTKIGEIDVLRRMLSEHLAKSPCFMYSTEEEISIWLKRASERDSRIFIASKDGAIVSFVEAKRGGENFVVEADHTMNIGGAFCLPEYRGRGIFQNLLNYVINILKSEGTICLGVDYESFNPTANGFWGNYFSAYTSSVVRRIDENILRRKK